MPVCLLGIGSNLGDRAAQVRLAVERLRSHPRIHVVAVSRPFATCPVGGPAGQGEFLNAAATVETSLSPHELLDVLQQVESDLGRRRALRWEARAIDLDLLLYGDLTIRDTRLEVPHPWMVARRFVLEPAAEVAAAFRHPLLGWTIQELWDHLRREPARYALIGGLPQEVVAEIALRSLATHLGDPVPSEWAALDLATGPIWDEPLECERARAARLAAAGWNELPVGRRLLADFWLPESHWSLRCDDGSNVSTSAVNGLQKLSAPGTSAAAAPKLVLFASGPLTDNVPAGSHRRLRGLDLERVGIPHLVAEHRSPFVRLPARDRTEMIREAVGAILAMDPDE